MSRIYQVEQPDNTSILHDIGFERNISIINGQRGSYNLFQYALMAFEVQSNPLIRNMVPFVTSGGTNSKTANSNSKFPIGCQIYYHPSSSAFTSSTFTDKIFYTSYEAVDARYTSTQGSVGLSTSQMFSSVYLRVSVTSDYTRWSPYNSGEIIVTSDELVSNNYYIYLGRKCASDTYTFQLEDNHPMYYYDGKSLIEFGVYVASQSGGGGGGGTTTFAKYVDVDPNIQFTYNSQEGSYTSTLTNIPTGLYFVIGTVNIEKYFFKSKLNAYVGLAFMADDGDPTPSPVYMGIGGATHTLSTESDYTQIAVQGMLNLESIPSGNLGITMFVKVEAPASENPDYVYAEVVDDTPASGTLQNCAHGLTISLHRVGNAIPT